MNVDEMNWWTRVRNRGALWYVVNKGLAFFLVFPTLGCIVLGWEWEPMLLAEGWFIGLVCGGFVWMRKELRYRFTYDLEGRVIPDRPDE